jgi:hypothetical protein
MSLKFSSRNQCTLYKGDIEDLLLVRRLQWSTHRGFERGLIVHNLSSRMFDVMVLNR